MGEARHRGASIAAAACGLLALCGPASAAAAPVSLTSHQSAFTGATISVKGGEEPEVLDRVRLRGRVAFPRLGESALLTVKRDGQTVLKRRVKVDPLSGRYRASLTLKGCCHYLAQVSHGAGSSYPLGFEVGVPRSLERPRQALLFNRLLRRAGYHMGDEPLANREDERTGLAVMAMRKVHDMERSSEYHPALFRTLLRGEGRFEPEHDDPGRHVEVDVSRQVMALVEDGTATDVFHVSTGAGGTPTGEWTFYSKTPGYNAKGMYYSAFYDGNYATHGYYTVPTYPASHGCTRNPEAYSVFIYDWIELGMPIFVYA